MWAFIQGCTSQPIGIAISARGKTTSRSLLPGGCILLKAGLLPWAGLAFRLWLASSALRMASVCPECTTTTCGLNMQPSWRSSTGSSGAAVSSRPLTT